CVFIERLLEQVKLPVFNKQPPLAHFNLEELDTTNLREMVARATGKPALVVAVDPDERIAAAFVQLMDDRRPRWLFYGMTESVWNSLPADKREGQYVVSSFVLGSDAAMKSSFGRIH